MTLISITRHNETTYVKVNEQPFLVKSKLAEILDRFTDDELSEFYSNNSIFEIFMMEIETTFSVFDHKKGNFDFEDIIIRFTPDKYGKKYLIAEEGRSKYNKVRFLP